MSKSVRVWGRKLHRLGAVLVALPFLVVILTGLLLQVKKDVAWVQPPTRTGHSKEPAIAFDQLLTAVRGVPEAGVQSWADVDRVDVRPKDGVAKVTCKNRTEVQIDFTTGEVVQVAYRRSDLIESIHDGSFFADSAKLFIFLPTAVIVLGLWLTGMYLWVLPHSVKFWRRRAEVQRAAVRKPVPTPGPES